MQHELTNCYFRYYKIGLFPGKPSGNSDGKNPGTWVESRLKAPGVGMLVLGTGSCTTPLEVNIHKTIRRMECSCYCCGL